MLKINEVVNRTSETVNSVSSIILGVAGALLGLVVIKSCVKVLFSKKTDAAVEEPKANTTSKKTKKVSKDPVQSESK